VKENLPVIASGNSAESKGNFGIRPDIDRFTPECSRLKTPFSGDGLGKIQPANRKEFLKVYRKDILSQCGSLIGK
jgi:hypothetical protein